VGDNPHPYGGGGRKKITKQQIKKSQQGGSHKKGCCPMVAAVRSVKDGNLRLTYRYTRASIRVLGQRATGRPVGVWA